MSLLSSEAESEFILPPPFGLLIFNGLGDTHPHWGEPFALLSSPIQMLISSESTFTNTLRNNV